MRSADEMYHLILEIARRDERIRAVILNGSRADPTAPADILQDFDIVYLVQEVAPFVENPQWLQPFGDLMIMQQPDAMEDPPPQGGPGYTYLMQFTDGNRIDLTLFPVAQVERLQRDAPGLILLDKDGLASSLPPGKPHLPQPPTPKAFADCCNEFWWVSTYVAKGLWRREILYARRLLDGPMQAQVMKMLTWKIGIQNEFAVNPGKFGRHFEQYLEPETWRTLLATYTRADYAPTWEALETMCRLFRDTALFVAEHSGFEYPHRDDERVSAYRSHIRTMPRPPDAQHQPLSEKAPRDETPCGSNQ